MKPNELRIGNFVYLKHCEWDFKTPRKVNSTTKPNLLTLERVSVNRIEYNSVKPIVLTEEWLLNFGFKKHKCNIGGADMWQGMDAWSINDNNWLFRGNPIYGLKLVGYFNSNIEYVHQLQNLYFALTGIELTYGDNK